MDDLMVVSPDVGGVARARELAKRINAPPRHRRQAARKGGRSRRDDGDRRRARARLHHRRRHLRHRRHAVQGRRNADGGTARPRFTPTSPTASCPARRWSGSQNSVMKIAGHHRFSIEPTEAVKAAKNIRIVPTAPMFAQAILNIWNGTRCRRCSRPKRWCRSMRGCIRATDARGVLNLPVVLVLHRADRRPVGADARDAGVAPGAEHDAEARGGDVFGPRCRRARWSGGPCPTST